MIGSRAGNAGEEGACAGPMLLRPPTRFLEITGVELNRPPFTVSNKALIQSRVVGEDSPKAVSVPGEQKVFRSRVVTVFTKTVSKDHGPEKRLGSGCIWGEQWYVGYVGR